MIDVYESSNQVNRIIVSKKATRRGLPFYIFALFSEFDVQVYAYHTEEKGILHQSHGSWELWYSHHLFVGNDLRVVPLGIL